MEIAIREKGFTFAAAAKPMSISRRTLYNYFEDPELSWQKIIDFDQILGLGLHNKFTDLRKYIAPTLAPSIGRRRRKPKLLEKQVHRLARKIHEASRKIRVQI